MQDLFLHFPSQVRNYNTFITCSYSKAFKTLHMYSWLAFSSLWKTRIFGIMFGRRNLLWFTLTSKRYCWILELHLKIKNHQIKFRNWFMLELSLVLSSLYGKLQHLASPDKNYFKYFVSLLYSFLSVKRTEIFEKNGKKYSPWKDIGGS